MRVGAHPVHEGLFRKQKIQYHEIHETHENLLSCVSWFRRLIAALRLRCVCAVAKGVVLSDLLARDTAKYGAYFPAVRLIAPER